MLYKEVEKRFKEYQDWISRRKKGIPNNRRLWVLACMDERVPVEEALGIKEGDAHIFRNAGGIVTDDAIRSAMLSCVFFGTREIIVINHTDCGMMTATGEEIAAALKEKLGVDPDTVTLNPALPELRLPKGTFPKWVGTFKNVDEVCAAQVEYLRRSPLIPDDVVIHGYIWDVERRILRPPYKSIPSEK